MRLAAWLLLILAFAIPSMAGAQTPPRLASLEVDIWPEYDRPQALVIYKARLAEGTPLPAVVRLPIPSEVGEPHAVAAWTEDGSLNDQISWSRSEGGEWAEVEVETRETGIWLEFYQSLEGDGAQRSLTFTWPGGMAIEDFRYQVLHPLTAEDFAVNPGGELIEDARGMTYTEVDAGALSPQSTHSLTLSYISNAAPPPPSALQAENPAFDRLEVALWPEYDQPRVLVFYRALISPQVELPAEVALPIPASVGEPSAVAFQGENGELLVAEYRREVVGDWAWIYVQAESPGLWIEYYDDLGRSGTERSYAFTWPGGVSIGALTYEVQQPAGATDMRVAPAGAPQIGDFGLTYYRSSLGPRERHEEAMISLAYLKGDDALSVDATMAGPALERPATTQGSTPNLTDQLPYILGAFGLVLVLVGGVLLWRTRRGGSVAVRRARKPRRSRPRRTDASEVDASPIFCHVCGAQAAAGDLYCRRCGAKLRR